MLSWKNVSFILLEHNGEESQSPTAIRPPPLFHVHNKSQVTLAILFICLICSTLLITGISHPFPLPSNAPLRYCLCTHTDPYSMSTAIQQPRAKIDDNRAPSLFGPEHTCGKINVVFCAAPALCVLDWSSPLCSALATSSDGSRAEDVAEGMLSYSLGCRRRC